MIKCYLQYLALAKTYNKCSIVHTCDGQVARRNACVCTCSLAPIDAPIPIKAAGIIQVITAISFAWLGRFALPKRRPQTTRVHQVSTITIHSFTPLGLHAPAAAAEGSFTITGFAPISFYNCFRAKPNNIHNGMSYYCFSPIDLLAASRKHMFSSNSGVIFLLPLSIYRPFHENLCFQAVRGYRFFVLPYRFTVSFVEKRFATQDFGTILV